MKLKILLVGESWVSLSTHIKGFNFFASGGYETGVEWFRKAMASEGVDWVHMPSHIAQSEFPFTVGSLRDYSAIILSDVGADTFLLHPDTWVKGKRTPNRLKVIEEYVKGGGGLIMAGGYLSFQGLNGMARYNGTPIENALPITIYQYDDRCEVPEGIEPIKKGSHIVTEGLPDRWPFILGYNKLQTKDGSEVLATVNGDPFLTLWSYGRGRAAAWATDIGPHWCPPAFAEWEGYSLLWNRLLKWVSSG